MTIITFNCDNYRSNARVFNQPHHRIENDPRVQDQAAALIDAALAMNVSDNVTAVTVEFTG